jgi:hypothetical protein
VEVTVQLQGTILAGPPQVGLNPGSNLGQVGLQELEQFSQRNDGEMTDLPANDTFPIPFGRVEEAKFVYLKASGPVTVLVTWATGVDQSIPCDGTFIVKTRENPITAISVVTPVASAVDSVAYLVVGDRS